MSKAGDQYEFTSAEDILAQTEAIIADSMKPQSTSEPKGDTIALSSEDNIRTEDGTELASGVQEADQDPGQSTTVSRKKVERENTHSQATTENEEEQNLSDLHPTVQREHHTVAIQQRISETTQKADEYDQRNHHQYQTKATTVKEQPKRSPARNQLRDVDVEYVTNMNVLSNGGRAVKPGMPRISRPAPGSKDTPGGQDFVELVFGDAPGSSPSRVRVDGELAALAPKQPEAGLWDTVGSLGSTSGRSPGSGGESSRMAANAPTFILGRSQALERAGVRAGKWCLALEVKLRPDAATAVIYSTLTEILLSHHLVVILREKGRLVAELRDRALGSVGSGNELLSVVRTITIVHGLAEKDKQRTLWVCVAGGKTAASGAMEKIGSFASSFTSALFEPASRQREALAKGTNAMFVLQLFDSVRNGLMDAQVTLSSLPAKPPTANGPRRRPGAGPRVEITVKDLIRRGGLAEQHLDHEYFAALLEVYAQQLNRELEGFAQPLELYARDQEWRLAQLVGLLHRTFEDCHVPLPALERAAKLDSFPLEEVAPKPAVFHREPTTREVDSLTKHALSAKCFAESNARKKRKHLEVTERVDVCERNRVKFVQILRDSEAVLASKTTLEFLHLFQLTEPEAVLCSVSCVYLGKMGTLYITYNHMGFYANMLGYRTRFLILTSNCRSVHKTKGTTALSMLTGDGILVREFNASIQQSSFATGNVGDLVEHFFVLPVSADCARVFELLIQISRMRATPSADVDSSGADGYLEPASSTVDVLREFSLSTPVDGTDALSEGSLSIASSNASERAGGAAELGIHHFDRLTSTESDFSHLSADPASRLLPPNNTRSVSTGSHLLHGDARAQRPMGLPLAVSHSEPSQSGDADLADSSMFYSSMNVSDSQLGSDGSVGSSMASQTGDNGQTSIDSALRIARDVHQRHVKRSPLSQSVQALMSPSQSPSGSINGEEQTAA